MTLATDLATASAPPRGRRVSRTSGDERQRALLETAERLLAEKPFGAITIDELAVGAGLSRPAFYFYFSSKQAVLLELLDRMVGEVDAGLAALPRLHHDRRGWWRAALGVFVEVFGAHRAVTRALTDARAHDAIAEVWAERSARWIAETTAVIVSEQRHGAVRADLDARGVSTALNRMNERAIGGSIAGEDPSVAADALLDTLLAVWLGAIYGELSALG